MKAEVRTEGNLTVIDLIGHIDYETTEGFKRDCLRQLKGRVVFNFKRLSFVGSSGITAFISALQYYIERSTEKTKFCEISSEFRKIFAVGPLKEVEVFDEVNRAISSYYQPVDPPFMAQQQSFPHPEPVWVERSRPVAQAPYPVAQAPYPVAPQPESAPEEPAPVVNNSIDKEILK
jgi:anti-anti-sigma factor